MKIKAKYILILLMLTANFSCNKYMDLLPPEGLVRDQYWKTKEEVQQVLMGAYTSFAHMDSLLFRYGELRADMVTNLVNLDEEDVKIMRGNIYPDNQRCSWFKFYQVINYCNEVIENAPLVREKDNTFTDFQLKGFLSEAYFLRSLSYFYLVRIFKDVPLVLKPSKSDDSDFYLPKTDGDLVLTQITNDLIAYRDYATIDGYKTIAENKGRATKGAIDALLADIALWRFDYASCIKHVDNIIASTKYQLMPMDRWFELFYPGNSLEGIFEFQFNQALNQSNSMNVLTSNSGNALNYAPSKKAIEKFLWTSDHPELKRGEEISIKKNGEGDYSIWKYIGKAGDGTTTRSGTEANSCNWIVYRLADVLLMKAEALSQIGEYKAALAILNAIRARAGFNDEISLAYTPGAFEDRIIEERALELAFEGKRWFDLLRMGRRNNYYRKSKLIEIIIQNVASSQKRILATKLTNPLGWYLPIYDQELERNLALVQNPFYATNF